MNIGYDRTFATVNQLGTGIYVGRLAEQLQSQPGDHEIHFFSARQRRDNSKPKTLRTRIDTLYRDLIWMQVVLPAQAARSRVDILHMPANLSPLSSHCPVVLTILDTILFQTPAKFPIWQRNSFRYFVPRAARKAARVITISKQSKQDIIRLFQIPAEHVVITYPGISSDFQALPSGETDIIRRYYNLGRYIFTVGALEPRKNISRLLEAFAVLSASYPDIQLVHAGPLGWQYQDVFNKLNNLGMKDRVRFLGRVPLSHLVALYNGAEILVYPSLYEGFGLPVLEAMACGCPVITSSVSAIPEVVDDAAVLVDPYQIDGLVHKMHDVLENPDLARELRRRGFARASLFSWDRCANETLNVYQQALDSHG